MARKRKALESPIDGSQGAEPQEAPSSPVGELEEDQAQPLPPKAQPPAPEAETAAESQPEAPKAKRREEKYTAPPASVKHEAKLRDPDAEAAAAKPKVPKRRDLGGRYKCEANVRHNRVMRPPGTVLELTDAEARHYLEFSMVSPLD